MIEILDQITEQLDHVGSRFNSADLSPALNSRPTRRMFACHRKHVKVI